MPKLLKKLPQPHALTAAVAILWAALFSFIAYLKYLALQYNAMDLAIFTQAVHTTSRGFLFATSIHPPSYLVDHISPYLVVLAPLFKIVPHPLTLVTIQIGLTAANAWPLYKIGQQFHSNWTGFWIVMAFLLNPFTQTSALFEFHTIHLLMFGFLWGVYAIITEKKKLLIPAILLMLFAREDAFILVAGLAALSYARTKKIAKPLVVFAVPAVYFLLVSQIPKIIFNQAGYKFTIYYQWLAQAIYHPLATLAHFINFSAIEFFIALLLPVGFLALGGGHWLLLIAAPLLQFWLGAPGLSTKILQLQYAGLFLPGIFIATIAGMQRFARTIEKFPLPAQPTTIATGLLILASAYATITIGPLQSVQHILPQDAQRHEWELLKKIPDDAAVAASYRYLAPLATRDELVSLNYAFLGRQQFGNTPYALPSSTEYLLIDYHDWLQWQMQYGTQSSYADAYTAALRAWPNTMQQFTPIAYYGSTVLFQKNAATPAIDLVALTAVDNKNSDTEQRIVDQEISWRGGSVEHDILTTNWIISPQTSDHYAGLYIDTDPISDSPNDLVPFGYGMIQPTPNQDQVSYLMMQRIHVPHAITNGIQLVRPHGALAVDYLGYTGPIITRVEKIGPVLFPTTE